MDSEAKFSRRNFLERVGKAAGALLAGVDSGSVCRSIIGRKDWEGMFDEPYLVAALYYSRDYYRMLAYGESSDEPAARILVEIDDLLDQEARKKYVTILEHMLAGSKLKDEDKVRPLSNFTFGKGINHKDAIDLFAKEGAEVRSITGGITVLAENGWNLKNPFSTVSPRGGNTVIICDEESQNFYRYCHLEKSTVKAGEVLRPGQQIGLVGHTGVRASQMGHGEHLHLEMNHVMKDYSVIAGTGREITALISKI